MRPGRPAEPSPTAARATSRPWPQQMVRPAMGPTGPFDGRPRSPAAAPPETFGFAATSSAPPGSTLMKPFSINGIRLRHPALGDPHAPPRLTTADGGIQTDPPDAAFKDMLTLA